MAIVENSDYVFVPKVTVILGGVILASLVATKKHLYIVPSEIHSGAGRRISIETFNVGDVGVVEGLRHIFTAAADVDALERTLDHLLQDDGRVDDLRVSVQGLEEFAIKSGFLSKGIYYRRPGAGRSAIAVSGGREVVRTLQQFYGLPTS